MAALAAEDADFDDATADTFFGGAPVSGRKAVSAHLRATFAGITRIEFRPMREFFSGEHAIFEGEVDWSFQPGPAAKEMATTGMPLVIVVHVHAGRVRSHRDYGDYRVFRAQYLAQQPPPARP